MPDYDRLRLKYLLTGELICQISETYQILNLVAQKQSKCWFGCSWKQTPKIKHLTQIVKKGFFGKEKTVEKTTLAWAKVCTNCGHRHFYSHITDQSITKLSEQQFNNLLSRLLGKGRLE